MSLFIIMHILFCRKNQKKRITERSKTIEAYFLTEEPSSWFHPADWIIENDLCCILCVVLEFFYQTAWVWIVFRGMFYPNSVKWLKCPKFKKELASILTCPKSAKWISNWTAQMQQNGQFENLYISSYGEAWNIKFRQQVNILKGLHWVLRLRR